MQKPTDDLNPEQNEAVLHTDGPLLILAGAGAGKTKTLTHRILHLIKTGVAPEHILAITFTNKAAKEMRERVTALLSSDAGLNRPVSFGPAGGGQPFVSTFHALGVYILKENARLIGLTRHFSIFDRGDSSRAVKEAIQEEGLDPKRFEPNKLLAVISREKGNMVTAERFAERAGRDYFSGIVAGVWKRYEAALRKEQALDFDDLLLKAALILESHPEVLAHYQDQWTHLHIDEYQDTNRVQYRIARMLAEKRKNICVVGDADQNIYSWRGADIRNILDFEKDYPDAKVILLERNYRSTQIILDSANAVIKKNKRRREKRLYTEKGPGEKIGLFEGYDETHEAHFVALKAAELIAAGASPNDIAVLYRANFQSRVLEEAFLTRKVPYQLLGTRFFERKEVKDIVSYLRAALNPEGLSDLKRIINVPARGIGKVTLLKILSGKESELSGTVKEKIARFREVLASIRELVGREKPSTVVRHVLKASGIEADLRLGGSEDIERLENLQELVTLATKYDALAPQEGIERLIEEAALQSDQDELGDAKKDGVKLMTVHASKGLEFDTVFITGLEEDLFPHRRMTEEGLSEEQAEEERRLFYVALTRAKKKLYLSFTSVRTIFGSKHINIPSEFLGDLDDAHTELEELSVSAARDADSTADGKDDGFGTREKTIFFD